MNTTQLVSIEQNIKALEISAEEQKVLDNLDTYIQIGVRGHRFLTPLRYGYKNITKFQLTDFLKQIGEAPDVIKNVYIQHRPEQRYFGSDTMSVAQIMLVESTARDTHTTLEQAEMAFREKQANYKYAPIVHGNDWNQPLQDPNIPTGITAVRKDANGDNRLLGITIQKLQDYQGVPPLEIAEQIHQALETKVFDEILILDAYVDPKIIITEKLQREYALQNGITADQLITVKPMLVDPVCVGYVKGEDNPQKGKMYYICGWLNDVTLGEGLHNLLY